VEGELLHQPQRGHALRIRVLAGLVQLKRQLCKASCKSGCITADIARQIEGSHIIKRYFELGKRQAPFGGMPGSTHLQTSIELVIIDLLERIDKLVVVLLVVEREEIERRTLDLGIALDGPIRRESGRAGEILEIEQILIAQVHFDASDIHAVIAGYTAEGVRCNIAGKDQSLDIDIVDLDGNLVRLLQYVVDLKPFHPVVTVALFGHIFESKV